MNAVINSIQEKIELTRKKRDLLKSKNQWLYFDGIVQGLTQARNLIEELSN